MSDQPIGGNISLILRSIESLSYLLDVKSAGTSVRVQAKVRFLQEHTHMLAEITTGGRKTLRRRHGA